jgi:hypothetical protein
MMNAEKENVKQLVARLKDMQARTGEKFPEWMLDENRYGKEALTDAEIHEWAETVCRSMRSTVALRYLIECEKRWGMCDGEYHLKSGEFVFGLGRELIESLLIEHVEGALLETKQDRYIAVYQFYKANDQRLEEIGENWFTEFLDDIFTDLAARMRSGEKLPVKPSVH